MTISKRLEAFLRDPVNQTLLSNYNFKELYTQLPVSNLNLISQFTSLMYSLNIDPLEYLDRVPQDFLKSRQISKVTIPHNITSIGKGAFLDCKRLADVIIPASVTSIDSFAFYGCSSLTSVTIPDSVTSIGEYAFCDCSGLTSVKISKGVTCIRRDSFSSCTGLIDIIIPDSITDIGEWAFSNCSELANVVIGSGLTSIHNSVFGNCKKLEALTYRDTKKQWNNINKSDNWMNNSSILVIHCTDGDIQL